VYKLFEVNVTTGIQVQHGEEALSNNTGKLAILLQVGKKH
jgi:hypothetical protein